MFLSTAARPGAAFWHYWWCAWKGALPSKTLPRQWYACIHASGGWADALSVWVGRWVLEVLMMSFEFLTLNWTAGFQPPIAIDQFTNMFGSVSTQHVGGGLQNCLQHEEVREWDIWSPLWSCQIAWAFILWEIPNTRKPSLGLLPKRKGSQAKLCAESTEMVEEGSGFQGTKALKLSQTFGSYLSKFWQQVVQRVKEFLYFTNAFFRCLV